VRLESLDDLGFSCFLCGGNCVAICGLVGGVPFYNFIKG
jgi:hypothetical protein